jgi:hypothetical protein
VLDQPLAVRGNSCGGRLGGAGPRAGGGLVGAQLDRIRVEAEADLAAALFDERREPIRERDQGRFSP